MFISFRFSKTSFFFLFFCFLFYGWCIFLFFWAFSKIGIFDFGLFFSFYINWYFVVVFYFQDLKIAIFNFGGFFSFWRIHLFYSKIFWVLFLRFLDSSFRCVLFLLDFKKIAFFNAFLWSFFWGFFSVFLYFCAVFVVLFCIFCFQIFKNGCIFLCFSRRFFVCHFFFFFFLVVYFLFSIMCTKYIWRGGRCWNLLIKGEMGNGENMAKGGGGLNGPPCSKWGVFDAGSRPSKYSTDLVHS